MISTTPLISSTSILRIALASLFIVSLAVCRDKGQSAASDDGNVIQGAEKPSGANDFINSIGLNTHLSYFDRLYGNFPLVEHELMSIGVLHLRDGVHLQNQDYNATLYGRWSSLGKMGIRFDAVLDPRNKLGPLDSKLLDQVDGLAGGTIDAFEGPNELDVTNDKGWTDVDRNFQKEIFAAVRGMANAKGIRVIGPSLAFASNSAQIGDLTGEMDEGNLHPYPAGKIPSAIFPEQVNLEKSICGEEPIVFTESGYHNAINEQHDQPGISEAAGAKYIPRLYLENFAHGIPRTYLYEFMDEAPEPGLKDPQMHWGLLRADGSEKPAFAALKNLMDEVRDNRQSAAVALKPLGWSLSPVRDQVHHLLLQKADGVYDLVLWQEISSYDLQKHSDVVNSDAAATLQLSLQAHNVVAYEPAKQTTPIKTWTNVRSVPLAIPDHPLVLEIAF